MSRRALNATVALAAAAGLAPDIALAAPIDPATLVKLEQIDAPIVDAGKIDGVLHLQLVVETRSASSAAALVKRMPELRAASLAAAIEFGRLRASPFAALDVSKLAQTLTPALKQVDPGIARVLIVRATAFRH